MLALKRNSGFGAVEDSQARTPSNKKLIKKNLSINFTSFDV
tara:strand:+ start:1685 stop:1807 length:123 start_codon:yes stop_codon:yes gene_type:complete